MVETLPYFFLGFLHEIGDVDKELAVEMRAAGAVEPEKIVSRLRRRLCGRARGNVLHRNVVDRDRDLVLSPQSLANLSNQVSYSGTKWAHCTIDSDLSAAKRLDTNGAESIGAEPAAARVRPCSSRTGAS